MPRIARLLIDSESTIYHVMSRTALDGFPMGDKDKEYLFNKIKRYSKLYFLDIIGYCLLDNHFHILLKMHPGNHYSDKEIKERYTRFYEDDLNFKNDDIQYYRDRWSSLSCFMSEIKLRFTRFYNRCHNRRGFFWGGRFKSVIVDKGETLINCLAYIDLNPVRAHIVDKPELYRWCSLGYLIQTGNKDKLLNLDFGLTGQERMTLGEKIQFYRKYVYEIGAIKNRGASIKEKTLKKERKKDYKLTKKDLFLYRTRYFTDSGIIGSKKFVEKNYQRFKHHFISKKEKKPKPIEGLDGIFSMKKLTSI